MSFQVEHQITKILEDILSQMTGSEEYPSVDLEVPADSSHGDLSTNIAMKSAKTLRQAPVKIAEQIVEEFRTKMTSDSEISSLIESVDIKGPGFINFFFKFSVFSSLIENIFNQKENYGQSDFGQKKKVLVEFVSANPTGSLSVAHARQAAIGDALVNLLNTAGFEAYREYYINDGGNQIRILGQSIQLRAQEILGEAIEFPEDCYQGEYIKDMAQIFMDDRGVKDLNDLKEISDDDFQMFGKTYLLDVIKKDLEDFGVSFDQWTYESEVANHSKIEQLIADFDQKGLLYEKEGALWFKTTDYGDDKDRVLRKSDGSYTYLTPDIVYHKNKFDRGFAQVYDILGPDHHGYIKRLKAAAQALGKSADDLEVLIVQLATLYQDGQVLSMSTRRGEYISLREVIDEVGVDAGRFFFLMRNKSSHLEFDLDLAKKQSSDNPVYYIQYAHARVFSIDSKAQNANIESVTQGFESLTTSEEKELIKQLANFSSTIQQCSQQMDPYPMVNYLQETASMFHKFYDKCRVVDENNVDLSSQRLGLCHAVRIVLSNGLKILGLSRPEKM